ncbi:MAG: riboflavin synthase [Firmicutes bacterium]|nr:riboflavin synthase [Bacillota bacterium]
MFTGIVEEKGIIRSLNINGSSGTIRIESRKVLEGTSIGDSIAVNGICLTVTSMGDGFFTADVMAETVRRSSLGILSQGSEVNLERAMAANGRFGGHIVSGHIDGTGTVRSLVREENAIWVTIETPPEILKYIVHKGSICIDGISLTVASVGSDNFKVSVIPHTGSETTLLSKRPGSPVNLENDIIAKYVERLMNYKEEENNSSSGITMEMLAELGI